MTEIIGTEITFEDFKHQNGSSYWWASELMKFLDYKDMNSFQKVIDRATKTCITLGIPHYENFQAVQREIDGTQIQDFKLTRFACYLAVMNGDTKKKNVAAAQVYFAELTRKFELYIQNSDEFERIGIRDELKEGNKSLSTTAKNAGVTDYAKFNNAGYRGLYNMYNWELAKRRNIEPNELYEYMSRAELAANLFRVTQTEERIKHFEVKGQNNLEQTHYNVGKEVRQMVTKNTGKTPENLPIEKKIPELHKELKAGYKKMIKADTPTKSRVKKKKDSTE